MLKRRGAQGSGAQGSGPERQRQDVSPRPDRAAAAGERRERRSRPAPADREKPVASAPAETLTSAAAARLGGQGLQRLRARHRDMLSRIEERVGDEGVRGELNALAERLNPDRWLTEADVASGLESYEPTLDQLRRALGGFHQPGAAGDPSPEQDPSSGSDH